MKKLITLTLLCAAFALSATAQPQPAQITPKQLNRATVTPKTADHNWPTGEYKSLGTGSMTDDMVTAIYNYKPVQFDVEIQQSVDDPNFIRVIAPYGANFAKAMLSTNNATLAEDKYDAEGKCVLNIDLTNPDDVYFPKTYIGCDWGHGEMYIGIPTSANVTYADGVITAPVRGVAVGDDDGATAQNTHQMFRIVMPGVTPSDYRLELSDCSNCLTTRDFSATITVGNDIATVKYTVIPNMQEDEMSSYIKSVATSNSIFTPRDKFSYEMDNVNKETLILVGLDKNGNTVANKWLSYYYIDNSEDWQDVGTAQLTDAILKTLYNTDIKTFPCTMQQHKYRPGYLRLVNPYSQSPYNQDRYMESGHNHYIYINADNVETIHLDESPLGLNFGHGMCRVWSQIGYWVAAGETLEDAAAVAPPATVDGQKLTFDDESLLFSAMDYSNGDWYMVKAGTEITLPDGFTLGVSNISADDDTMAPATYYNLQGVQIQNPTSGLYIKRQAGKTTKILVK